MILALLFPEPNGYLAVKCPYDDAIVAQLKAVPGCHWDKREKVWRGPAEAIMIVMERLERAQVLQTHFATYEEGQITSPLFASRTTIDAPANSSQGKQLYDYQKTGALHLIKASDRLGGALLADEMGLGKTAQVARAIEALVPKRVLVLCPALVVPTWLEQLREWTSAEPVRLGLTTKKGKAAQDAWAEAGGIGVLSYDSFRSRKLPQVDVLVLDEGHYLSNPHSRRSKAVRAYLDSCDPRPRVLMTTGTPMTARIRDLWHPLDLLTPKRWGSKFDFERRYAEGQFIEVRGLEKPVWVAGGASNLDELHRRLTDSGLMLRRLKGEVLELPERQRIVMPIDIPEKQRAALARVSTTLDPTQIGRALSAIEEHKMAAAIELAEELLANGKRVLLFTTRRETARQLGEALNAPYVTGEDAAAERLDKLRTSNIGVATIGSAATGLDGLQHVYDTAIFVGLDWVPSTLAQAEARIHRIGQGSSVTIYYLVGLRTIDEAVREVVLERLDQFAQVVGAAEDEKDMALALRGGQSDRQVLDNLAASILAANEEHNAKG